MSRYYDMQLHIYQHNPDRVADIQKAIDALWGFDNFDPAADDEGERNALFTRGEGSLGGGYEEDQFIEDVSKAIWKANGGFCKVSVTCICLDDADDDSHSLDEEDYERLM